MTPVDFSLAYGLPMKTGEERVKCSHAPCSVCGGDLDFGVRDPLGLGRSMEACHACKTLRPLPLDRHPPKPRPLGTHGSRLPKAAVAPKPAAFISDEAVDKALLRGEL